MNNKITPWGQDSNLWAREYCDKALSAFWLWTEIQMEQDISDYKSNLSQNEKEIIKDILKTFTQSELLVEEYWTQRVAPMFKDYPEIVQAAITMGSFEVIHVRSYAYLNEVLGLEDEFSKFLTISEFNNKMNEINNYLSSLPDREQLLLFSAFVEGVCLYSSFLVLGSFQFRNLMKGVGRIIEFSIKDECASEGTKILTPRGWVDFRDLKEGETVYQYNEGILEEVTPSRLVKNHFTGNLVKFQHKQYNGEVTPNHEVLYKKRYGDFGVHKISANQFKNNVSHQIPTQAALSARGGSLTPLQRLLIAVQADGSLLKTNDKVTMRGANGGYNVSFGLTRTRKKDRLRNLLLQAKLKFKETVNGNESIFSVHFDEPTKNLDWIYKLDMDLSLAEDIIQEVVQWDGHIRGDTKYVYCSTDKNNVDVIQWVATLAGYSTHIVKSEDTRKESYKTYYRLSIYKTNGWVTANSVKKSEVEYSGNVYCVTVPSGVIVTQFDGINMITGNCLHHQFGTELALRMFAEKLDEQMVRNFATSIYNLEIESINYIFRGGDLENLKKEHVVNYIKNRINEVLRTLGFGPLFTDVSEELLGEISWFDVLTSGLKQSDFFAGRETGYKKWEIEDTDLWGDKYETLWI